MARMRSRGSANAGGPAGDADEARRTCAKCSLTMEAYLWRHMRHVRTLLYQVWEPSDFAGGKPGRDAAVVVKLPRLAYLLRVALDAMARQGRGGAVGAAS